VPKPSPKLKIHDFRVTDSVLAQTDPNAGDIVFLGTGAGAAMPFVVWRKISGPNGVYIDAWEFVAPDGTVMGPWERSYEIEGEAWTQDQVDEIRGMIFRGPGKYTARYYEFDTKVLEVTFEVVAKEPPYGIVVPGPVDQALSKSTIAWLEIPQPDGSKANAAVWYGYENGRVYVLSGPGEQPVPGIEVAGQVRLIARSKDVQSRVGEVDCTIEVLRKGPEWDRIARDILVGRRLNLRDGEGAVARWRETCEIYVLTPVAVPITV
jgi:hypothetical protein